MVEKEIKPTIYFRADGNTQIGLGHITRSMALADMLKEEFHCIFLVQNPSEILQKQIRENFELITLPETEDYLAEAKFIKENIITENDTVVLDGYNFQTEYQKILNNDYHHSHKGERLGVRLICIDDLHAWHFVADAIINHAGGVQPSDYSCESYTKLYLGTDYALLRKPFLEAAKKERTIERIENVFICFGGSDVHNLSLKATEACLSVLYFKEIHVVLGSAYPFYEEFAKFAQAHHKIKLHQNLNAQEMCDLMQSCELAIAPASSVAYEVCAVGMYLITGWYAENQQRIYKFLVANNLGLGVENFEKIEENLLYFSFQNNHVECQKKYFDGSCFKRLKTIFYDLLIDVRKATIEDMELYFDWANEPEVRKNSLNTEPIIWEDHQRWFFNKIKDENCLLFLFKIGSTVIGQVRIDINNDIGIINYSIHKNFRGLGLGVITLSKAILQIQASHKHLALNAIVKKENIASWKVFQNIGFTLIKEENEILTFSFT